jgi:hypothetical protein
MWKKSLINYCFSYFSDVLPLLRDFIFLPVEIGRNAHTGKSKKNDKVTWTIINADIFISTQATPNPAMISGAASTQLVS